MDRKIQPPVTPATFRLNIHPVLDDKWQEISGLYVVEVSAPRGNLDDLYATASGEAWVKTDGASGNSTTCRRSPRSSAVLGDEHLTL